MPTILLPNVAAAIVGIASGPHRVANKTFQATVTGTGAVSATVNIEVSNDQVTWLTTGTITLAGTTTASDGFATNAQWEWIRGNLTAITGTGATVLCTLSV